MHSSHSFSGSESATMPAPAPTCIKLSFITAVLIAIAVSIFPFHEIYPIAPPYIPLELGSSSFIIYIALIFGAPESVPAGRVALSASIQLNSLDNFPTTFETICIT